MVRPALMSEPSPLHPPPLPRSLEVYEVAYLLRCSQEHVRRLIREGKLVAIRLGARSYRIEPADLQAFRDRQRVVNGASPSEG